MSTDSNDPGNPAPPGPAGAAGGLPGGNGNGQGKLVDVSIEDELKHSYLTYAMSVIVSRALPDARDGLKPSQRRILVAMNDLNLGPTAGRVKCAKICGDTSGNYHPHGELVIYPTLVRMAQEWNMRYVLVDKQGNYGSIAGLPPAQMRYTEARMSSFAAMMMEDIDQDTVDTLPTYDERRMEPTVLPSKFPNLLVNGANGIAVGYTTSVPPHNLGEICDALVALIDNPDLTIDELLEIVPGPDFPTGGIICGREGIRRGYRTGRATITLRGRAKIEEVKDKYRIVINEIPYQQVRDRVIERIAELAEDKKIIGIDDVVDYSDLKEPVKIVVELKRRTDKGDVDPEVVLNQLYQFSPLQETFSLIFLALVDGAVRLLNFKELLEQYLRHRVTVIRRRTQFLLNKARQQKHTVEGRLLAYANIDEVIKTIRESETQAQAKERLMALEVPSAMLRRALGDEGFAVFQTERGAADTYRLTPVQADSILRMTLGQLVNLEEEKLGQEFRELLKEIAEYERILSDDKNIRAIIRDDLLEMKKKHGDDRRTYIDDAEIRSIDEEDLIAEEPMVVTISHQGYIKRTPASVYRAQRRGGKGLIGARADEEDPIEHFFVASTHDRLLFFTNTGRVYWQKVYDVPQAARDSKGRSIVNLLNLSEGETIAHCQAVRDFGENEFLMMATRKGLVKKTALTDYGNIHKGGIIAIKLREGDELVDVVVTRPGDEVVLSTAHGLAIRFSESDARAMGRNTSGVKGVGLVGDDVLVGMVVAEPDATLLTACQNGYGKRTYFGHGEAVEGAVEGGEPPDDGGQEAPEKGPEEAPKEGPKEAAVETPPAPPPAEPAGEEGAEPGDSGGKRYRTQRRGGKGLRDIKATERNGPVVSVVSVRDGDEVMMISARGKIQRISVNDISLLGRNTQGVRIMTLDEGDQLAAVVRVPREQDSDALAGEGEAPPAEPTPGDSSST